MTPQVILLVAILCVCQSGGGAVQEETVTLRSRSGAVLSSWIDLLPKVISCYMSLAGCHLCNFFLGTYDLSVPFPACTTSCSLAVVKTCSSLVIASLQQRFD